MEKTIIRADRHAKHAITSGSADADKSPKKEYMLVINEGGPRRGKFLYMRYTGSYEQARSLMEEKLGALGHDFTLDSYKYGTARYHFTGSRYNSLIAGAVREIPDDAKKCQKCGDLMWYSTGFYKDDDYNFHYYRLHVCQCSHSYKEPFKIPFSLSR